MKDYTNGKLEEIRRFARETSQLQQFENCLNRLLERESKKNIGNGMDEHGSEIELYGDFSPHSLTWSWVDLKTGRTIMTGGLIYHGKHDEFGSGEAPSFAVTLEPTVGWSIHT